MGRKTTHSPHFLFRLVLGLIVMTLASCTPGTPKNTVTARYKGTKASLKLPDWSFVHYSEQERWYQYQNGSQQLYVAVSRYKLGTPQSPDENLIREALLELCPDKTCKPIRTEGGNFISSYSSGITGAVVYNWDAARLTSEGEMLLSILRLVNGTVESANAVSQAVSSSLKLDLE